MKERRHELPLPPDVACVRDEIERGESTDQNLHLASGRQETA
jgi:hypothetical protein